VPSRVLFHFEIDGGSKISVSSKRQWTDWFLPWLFLSGRAFSRSVPERFVTVAVDCYIYNINSNIISFFLYKKLTCLGVSDVWPLSRDFSAMIKRCYHFTKKIVLSRIKQKVSKHKLHLSIVKNLDLFHRCTKLLRHLLLRIIDITRIETIFSKILD